MRLALDRIAALVTGGRCDIFTLPWHQLRYEHTSAIRAKLADCYAPTTARRMLSALKGTLKRCWLLEQMTAEDYHRAIELPPIKGESLPPGRHVTAAELRALFGACAADPGVIGARDAALFAVLFGAGLRRAELVALDLDDYDSETGELKIRHGKGNKGRSTFANEAVRDAIDYWIEFRTKRQGPLFMPMTRGGRILKRRLNDQAVMDIAVKRGEEAGLKRFSPHDGRRSLIGNLLDAGIDIVTVQKLVGHSSPAVTARYDRRDDTAKRRAVEHILIPFTRSRVR